ncbi:hypothetical protein AT575_06225 [Streptococcus penaeicida]|uniref:DUF3397 domain-containing protein n=1 Tax=Streptococcus penaeicida TaxID=1765960 RepID=A0A2N8LBF5_9STRE|nr:DUF3397 domain-containing protein [Streptococcus penaeicida]PND47494.1 hypothetical protein AT575_06225 [Streptococcus penaeicida]
MMTYKLIAFVFLFLTPLISQILINLFKLGRYGLKFPDLAFIFFAIEIAIVSGKFFDNNFLPYYLIILSLLAIIITLTLVIRSQRFSYPRFFKLFWRIGFLMTFFGYFVLVMVVFTK